MKKRRLLFVFDVLIFFSIIYAKTSEPEWVSRYEELYPVSDYLVQMGVGTTSDLARTEGFLKLASYLNTSVETNLYTTISNMVQNGVVSEEISVKNTVELRSNVKDMFGFESTVPYFQKKTKKWYCLVYINRDVAYKQFESRIEDSRKEFYSFYNKAEEETDLLIKCNYISNSWKSATKFLELLEFANLINPKMISQYNQVRTEIASLNSELLQYLHRSSYRLFISGDYGDIITSKCIDAIRNIGLQENNGKATYTVVVEIYDNSIVSGKVISITPSIRVNIINNSSGNTVFNFLYKTESKEVAYTLDTARKRLYPMISQEFCDIFSKELRRMFLINLNDE